MAAAEVTPEPQPEGYEGRVTSVPEHAEGTPGKGDSKGKLPEAEALAQKSRGAGWPQSRGEDTPSPMREFPGPVLQSQELGFAGADKGKPLERAKQESIGIWLLFDNSPTQTGSWIAGSSCGVRN